MVEFFGKVASPFRPTTRKRSGDYIGGETLVQNVSLALLICPDFAATVTTFSCPLTYVE